MSSTKIETEWVVARLNYSEPYLHFLTKCVKPIVDTMIQTGIIERYYWERSCERGAHIRLYIRCHEEYKHTLVVPHLFEHFEAFFAHQPSVRKVEQSNFLPNNTIQLIDYQPNANQWGGHIGLPIAERHFQSSSEVILDFMTRKGSRWCSDDILETALEMHVGFAESANMTIEEAIRFFEYCLLHHAGKDYRLQYLEAFFDNQREPFVEFHAQLWGALQTKNEFQEDIYNQWIEQCFYSTADLVQSFRLRLLKVEAKFSALWTLYARLLHMTNNRLGLHGRDEALIYYIIMRSLEKIGVENMKM